MQLGVGLTLCERLDQLEERDVVHEKLFESVAFASGVRVWVSDTVLRRVSLGLCVEVTVGDAKFVSVGVEDCVNVDIHD